MNKAGKGKECWINWFVWQKLSEEVTLEQMWRGEGRAFQADGTTKEKGQRQGPKENMCGLRAAVPGLMRRGGCVSCFWGRWKPAACIAAQAAHSLTSSRCASAFYPKWVWYQALPHRWTVRTKWVHTYCRLWHTVGAQSLLKIIVQCYASHLCIQTTFTEHLLC